MRTPLRIRVFQYGLLVLILAIFLLPMAWLILSVFKSNFEDLARPPVLVPADPLAAASKNIGFAFSGAPEPLTSVIANSLVVSIASALASLILGVVAGYSFARFRTGGTNLPFLILTMRMAPPIAIGLPFFLVFRQLGLLDTQLGLVVAYTTFNLPLVIWLMRSFFREMDTELEDAALVDGATRWQALRLIALPLAAPAIVATGLLAFIASWNEFFFVVLLARSQAVTLPALIPLFLPRSIAPGQPFGGAFFLACLSAIPVVILALFLQRYLLRGLSLGAVKG